MTKGRSVIPTDEPVVSLHVGFTTLMNKTQEGSNFNHSRLNIGTSHSALGGPVHTVPYHLSLSVWVPSGAARAWLPCPMLAGQMTDELIQSCGELKSVFRAHGKLIARLLSAPAAPRYDGFRIVGRRKDTGLLIAAVEWVRSRETKELVPFPITWTSCKYVHPEDQLSVA